MGATRVAEAFAPAAISNFFAIHDGRPRPSTDYSRVGATGGGFMLSRGVYSRATVSRGSTSERTVRTRVNGDDSYRASTTRRAIDLLLDSTGARFSSLLLEQNVEVPIGYGFGSSAASALSAVMAASSALGLSLPGERVAYFAHAADIICKTGLGTVSSIYADHGAKLIVKAGAPGVAEVVHIRVPGTMRVVAAVLAPYRTREILSSSPATKRRINRLGGAALRRVLRDPRLETLVSSGEMFAKQLGLESPETRELIRVSKEHGAMGASQNMVGHAIHALVTEERVAKLVEALRSAPSSPDVLVFEVGTRPAGVVERGGVGVGALPYPMTSRSLG